MAEQGLTAGRLAPPATTPPELVAYLARLEEAAESAAAAVGGFQDAFCLLAGFTVRLRFAGPALMPRLLPALDHVRTVPVDLPALTIRLFDGASNGADLPSPPWDPGEVFRDSGRVKASIDGHLNGDFAAGTFSVYRPRRDHGLYWIRAADDIETSEAGSPLLTILHLWLSTRGVQVAHAGAVGDSEGCVLIVGTGGVGKSSTTLACLPSDLGLLGEDYCLLGPEDTPVVHTLYSSAKANADTIERLPFLGPMVSNPNREANEKALCLLADHVPDKLVARSPLRAVAIPRITGRRETATSQASPAAALAALAPSTLFQLRGATGEALARLARAVRAVPCHYLDVGTDPEGIPAAIRSLMYP